MPKPQQPELRRSEQVPDLAPDAAEGEIEAQKVPDETVPGGPVPPDQQPGASDDRPQDKPDPDAFAERLGVTGDDRTDDADPSDETDRPDEDKFTEPVRPDATSHSPGRSTSRRRSRLRPLAALVSVGGVAWLIVRRRRR